MSNFVLLLISPFQANCTTFHMKAETLLITRMPVLHSAPKLGELAARVQLDAFPF